VYIVYDVEVDGQIERRMMTGKEEGSVGCHGLFPHSVEEIKRSFGDE
jgi:hypothetical protein